MATRIMPASAAVPRLAPALAHVEGDFGSLDLLHYRGDTMAPTVSPGDVVSIDTSHRVPTPAGIYAVFDGLGVRLCRLEYLPGTLPRSVRVSYDNPVYPEKVVPLLSIRVAGRVTGILRRT